MEPFTLFMVLFAPGASLQVVGVPALLLWHRAWALHTACAGAILVGLAAALDKDFTLLAGQGLLCCILWWERRTLS